MAPEVMSWITDCDVTAHLLLHCTLNQKQANSISTFCVKFCKIKISQLTSKLLQSLDVG